MNLVERLQRLDTGAVSDALDKLGLRGAVFGIKPLGGPGRIAGTVVTVKLGLARGKASRRHLATAAIEAAEPGQILVVEHRARADCAGWGGILSRAASARQIAGTIVDGLVRDVDESRECGYPVFARGAIPVTARGRVVEEAWNVPIHAGDVEVRPGDLAIADRSGVAFVPAHRAPEVIELAEAIARRESAMVEALDRGQPVSRVLGGDYETMLDEDRDEE